MLRLNLQFFNSDPGDEFDLNKFREEFEASYEEETPDIEQQDEITDDIIEEPEEVGELEPEEVLESTEEVDAEPEQVEEKPVQSPEENAAFAEMRRKNQELERKAQIAEQVASQYGMTVEQFELAYAEQQLQQRAETQGVPLDVLKRLEATENELQQTKTQAQQEQFWGSVQKVKDTFGLEDKEVESVFRFMGEKGMFNPRTGLPALPFEDAYKLANFDSIMERTKKEDNQKRLADKKARQKKTAIPHTNASTPSNEGSEEDWTIDEVEKRLKARNLI